MATDTGPMAMDTTTERGLLRPSLLLRLLLPLRLRLIPGMDTMAMASTDLTAMDTTDTGLMAMDTTTERGLLRPSLLLRLLLMLLLRLLLIPGMDTTAMVDTEATMAMPGLMATMAITERGLLRLSLLLMLLLPLRLRLIPGMDTTAMASTDLMAMDTTDTGLMATTGERSKECNFCQTAAN